MARVYAKVSVKMWGDEKFCDLSPLPPSGQSLWLFLLTGKFRTSIPGINLNVGVGALSDRLGWSMSEVEKHWAEIAAKQMGFADWKAGVIWLPKAIEHNEPESPNVIRGWGKVVLPECVLTRTAIESLRIYLVSHLSKAYTEAFKETFGQGSRNQEQEQEQDLPPKPPAHAGGVQKSKRPRRLRLASASVEQSRTKEVIRLMREEGLSRSDAEHRVFAQAVNS